MSNEVTIDALQIEIQAESGAAADNLDALAKSLDRLQAFIQRMTVGGDGLNKVAKQIEKLNSISQKIQSMQGFEKLERAVESLKKLNDLNGIGDISGFVRNLNKLPQAINAIAQMPALDASKFQQLADALKPLQSVDTSGLNTMLNALRKLPKVSQELAGVDFARFAQQISQISQAIAPLARQAQSAGAGLTALAQIMQQTNRQARQSSDGVGLFNKTIGNIKVKTLAAIAGLRRLFSALKSGVTASAAYVENLNLFNVTMGESAGEALEFAEAVNAALGIDTSDWIRYQGVFQSIGKGFGIVSQKADVMSKNLTQLTYDISSFYNISADTAAEKLQSALSGQVMPMRQLGFAIEETTLKQVALNHGITESVENMTQAQKAQLRYIAIMEQAGSIGVLGDMARTIDTAANGMRVLQARMQQFARAVGNMVMPILSAALPYMTAFVQVLTEAAQAIANFFGFELPKIDFSGAAVSSGFDDITNAADEATKANEKFKGSLSSIDQLNIIGSKDDGKGNGNENQFDLGIELPEYDFLQGIESKTKEIAENIKNWFQEALPWIEAAGTAIAGAFAFSKIGKFVDGVKTVFSLFGKDIGTDKLKAFSKTLSGIVGGLAAGATSGVLMYNGIKNLITGTGKLGNNITQLGVGLGVAVGAMTLFMKIGNPVGAVLTGIGATIGLVAGVCKGLQEEADAAARAITDSELYNNGGTRIDEIAYAFGRLADEGTRFNQDVTAKYGAIQSYSENIEGFGRTIREVLGDDLDLGNLSIADAEALKAPFDELCEYLKTTFEDTIQAVADDVAGIFVELDLSGTIGAELQAAYRQLKMEMNDTITESQKTVDQYLSRITAGEQLTEAEMLEFQNNFGYVTERSLKGTEGYNELQGLFDELDLTKIDELSPEQAQEYLNLLGAKYDAYIQSVQDRYETEMQSIKLLQNELDDQLKYGLIDTETYNKRSDLLTISGNLFAEHANQQVAEMSKKASSVTDAFIQQNIDASKLVTPSGIQKWSGFWGGMDATELAQAQFLWKNDAYVLAQDLNSKFRGTSIDVEVKTTFADEGSAATWKILAEELNPKLDLEIGKILDKNGEFSYIVGEKQSMIDATVDSIRSNTKGWKIITGEETPIITPNMPYSYEYKQSLADFGSYGRSDVTLPGISSNIQPGYAREAYSDATQAGASAMRDMGINAKFTIHNYTSLDVDGETIAEGVTQSQQRQLVYSNGVSR